MAVAHQIAQESHTGTTGSTNQDFFDWSVQFAAGRRGLVVWVFANSASDFATSVKIDPTGANIDVPEVTGGRAVDTGGEPRSTKTFFLGTGLPTSTTTVRVNRTNNGTIMYAVSALVSAADDTEVYTPGIVLLEDNGTLAPQSVDDGSTGISSVRYGALASGLSSVPAVGAGVALVAIDLGVHVFATVRESAAGQGPRDVGWTSGTSDDRAAVHLAVREVVAVIPQGTVNGALSWTGSVAGTTDKSGTTSGAVAWVGTVNGEAPVVTVPEGTTTGAIGWAGAVTGTTERAGDATGSILWAGSATGVTIHAGNVSGNVDRDGTITGTATHEGSTTGSISWTGSVTGVAPAVGAQEGTVEGAVGWVGTVTGTTSHVGEPTGTVIWTGTVNGSTVYMGAVAGTVDWVGEVTSIVAPPPRPRLEASSFGFGWEAGPVSTGLEGSSI